MKVHAPVIVIQSFHKLGQGMVFQPAAGIVVPQVFLKRYRIIPGNTEEKRFRILKNCIDKAADQKLLFPFADDTFGLVHDFSRGGKKAHGIEAQPPQRGAFLQGREAA